MDPLRTNTADEDADARRRGEALIAQLRGMGLTDEEIFGDDTVAMTPGEVRAWLESGAPSPFAAR